MRGSSYPPFAVMLVCDLVPDQLLLHPLLANGIEVAILTRRLQWEVEADGARFRLFVLPGWKDLLDRQRRGEGDRQRHLDAREFEGVEVVDCDSSYLQAGADEDDS